MKGGSSTRQELHHTLKNYLSTNYTVVYMTHAARDKGGPVKKYTVDTVTKPDGLSRRGKKVPLAAPMTYLATCHPKGLQILHPSNYLLHLPTFLFILCGCCSLFFLFSNIFIMGQLSKYTAAANFSN